MDKMKAIFEKGDFSSYRLNESQLHERQRETRFFSQGGTLSSRITIFLSHKHDELEELKEIMGFLRSNTKLTFMLIVETQKCPRRHQAKLQRE